jgi:hypothetical protein
VELLLFITMQQALIYSLKVWLTSVLLSPLMSNVVLMLMPNGHSFMDFISSYFVQLLIGGFLSFCSFLILFVFTYLFIKQSFEEVKVKISLSFIGFVLAIIPIVWLTGWQLKFNGDLIHFIPYPLVVIIGIWFYSLRQFEDVEYITE